MGPQVATGCLLLALSGLFPGKADIWEKTSSVPTAGAGLAEAMARRASANLTIVTSSGSAHATTLTTTAAATSWAPTTVTSSGMSTTMSTLTPAPDGGSSQTMPSTTQEAIGNMTDVVFTNETTTMTVEALIGRYPRTAQQEICMHLRPVVGTWFAAYLLGSTCILLMVICGLKEHGAIMAMPMLAGLRYNLFADLWMQGLMQVLQAFVKSDAEEGCSIQEPYLLSGFVPMPLGKSWAIPLPPLISAFAVMADSVISGYVVVLLLIAMPRMRVMLRPGYGEDAEDRKHHCCFCIPENVFRYLAIPASVLLIVVNPIVLGVTHAINLQVARTNELIIFIVGVSMSALVARREREELSRLFEHIFLQEWGVLSAAIFTKIGHIIIASYFSHNTASFLIALASSLSTLGVMVYLVFGTAPWKDPIIWLAGQDWLIDNAQTVDANSRAWRAYYRKKTVQFILSMFSFPWTFQLILKDHLKGCRLEPRLREQVAPLHSWKSTKELHELVLGRKAWREWARWAEKVCSTWPGLKDRRTAQELTNVLPPTALTPEEKQLQKEGKLTRHSRWSWVFGDMFSDRVHSQEILVILLVLLLSDPNIWLVLTTDLNIFHTDPSISLLIQSMLFCVGVWMLLSIFLVCNNVFCPVPMAGRGGRRIWLFILGLISTFLLWGQTFIIVDAYAGSGVGSTDGFSIPEATTNLVWAVSRIVLTAMLASAAFRLVFVSHMPQVRNTYHRLEFAAQRYCQRLLEGDQEGFRMAVRHARSEAITCAMLKMLSEKLAKGETLVTQAVEPGQVYLVRNGRGTRPCLVTTSREDGTCSVVLQGGAILKDILHKDLLPLHTEARLLRGDKDFFDSIMEALAPVLDGFREKLCQGIMVIGNNVQASSLQIPGSPFSSMLHASESSVKGDVAKSAEEQDADKSAKKEDVVKPPEPVEPPEAPEPQDAPESAISAIGLLTGFSVFKARLLATERGQALTRALSSAEFAGVTLTGTTETDVERQRTEHEQAASEATGYALVDLATEKGKQRALQMERRRRQAQGFRVLFNSSVGLPSLMLVALLVGPLLLLFSACFMCLKVTEFERGLTRMQSGASYALRVQTVGFAYGACEPPSPSGFKLCEESINSSRPCGPPAPMLMWAFDADQTQMLEPEELEHMCRVLTSISVAVAVGGREESGLSRTDCRDLTRQAAWPGHDMLNEEGLEEFLCNVSQTLTEQNEQIRQAVESIENMENISANVLFPLADRNPRDGFLSQQELLGLLPTTALGARQAEIANTYGTAVRIGFLLGDTQPPDGRLSIEETDDAASYIGRLMQTIPLLAEDISAVQSGQRSTLNTALFIDVLDMNNDGFVSRVEFTILASIMDASASSSGTSRQVLAVFDMFDSDRDGLVQEAELDQILHQLAGGLALLTLMSGEADGELGVQSLLQVLDTDHDGALSRAEFDNLASFSPPQHAAQTAFAVGLIFGQADTSPRDGRLDGAEIEVAVQRVQALTQQQFTQPPTTSAGNAAGHVVGGLIRRLESAAPAVPKRRTFEFGEHSDGVDVVVQLSGFFAAIVLEREQETIDEYIRQYLWVFNSDEFLIICPLVLLGMRLSILGAVASACFMMLKTKREHERLTHRMQTGDCDYVGSSDKALLRNSFSVSTSFPGIFVATVVMNFLVAVFIIFLCLVIFITPCVLAVLPGTQHIISDALRFLAFPIFSAILKWLLKAVVVDWLLVEHGQPTYPFLFAPLWFTLVLLNSVQAPFLAVFRWAFLLVYAMLTSTYLHVCAVSELAMSLDPGYYAFIALTFTQSARRNLVRTCFISALMPQTQRYRGPAPEKDLVENAKDKDCRGRECGECRVCRERRHRRLRIRNKLWVAVTLWNNPELRSARRLQRKREFSSLMTLWDGQESLIPKDTGASATENEEDGSTYNL